MPTIVNHYLSFENSLHLPAAAHSTTAELIMRRVDRLFLILGIGSTQAFSPALRPGQALLSTLSSTNSGEAWDGQVVSNASNGQIRGCKIQPAKEDSVVDWELTIDGEEADLGRFSDAIYRKITQEAKQQRFQGFRPGTIPPHLEPTYRAFAMDECARETVLEALQQNNIRPFEGTRTDMFLKDFQIPPTKQKITKKKKKKTKFAAENSVEEEKPDDPVWRTFATMKEAVDAGWKPGQSFSFVAVDIKGQKVNSESDIEGSQPIGRIEK